MIGSKSSKQEVEKDVFGSHYSDIEDVFHGRDAFDISDNTQLSEIVRLSAGKSKIILRHSKSLGKRKKPKETVITTLELGKEFFKFDDFSDIISLDMKKIEKETLIKGVLQYQMNISGEKALTASLETIFNQLGLIGDDVPVAAAIAARAHLQCMHEKEWSKIPLYLEEKARRRVSSRTGLGETNGWSAHEHYKKYWKPWADKGVLYQFDLRRRDPKLESCIRAWCRRHGKDHTSYLPPVKSELVNLRASSLGTLPARKVISTKQAIEKRRQRSLTKEEPTLTKQ